MKILEELSCTHVVMRAILLHNSRLQSRNKERRIGEYQNTALQVQNRLGV